MSEKNERIIWVLYWCQEEVLVNKNTLILLPPSFSLNEDKRSCRESNFVNDVHNKSHIQHMCLSLFQYVYLRLDEFKIQCRKIFFYKFEHIVNKLPLLRHSREYKILENDIVLFTQDWELAAWLLAKWGENFRVLKMI